MRDLIVGAWRNGLSSDGADIVNTLEAQTKSGFHLFPAQLATLELVDLLDCYDEYAEWVDEPLVVVSAPPEVDLAEVKVAVIPKKARRESV